MRGSAILTFDFIMFVLLAGLVFYLNVLVVNVGISIEKLYPNVYLSFGLIEFNLTNECV